MKRTVPVAAILTLVFLLVTLPGCFPGGGHSTVDDRAGFFTGIWHGWIAPISLIVGIFRDGIRVYEVNNTGWWYDFGFYIAVIAGFGSISLIRHQKSSKSS
jgi:hypothetical protein